MSLSSDHSIEEGQQLMHAGGERQLLWFVHGQQSLVEGAQIASQELWG